MKTKKLYIEVLSLLPLYLFTFLLLTGCDDKLDIVPKGQSTLETVDDLELLLNKDIELGSPINDLSIICNECFGQMTSVPTVLSQTNTLEHAYLAYDEKMNRANLSQSDNRYTNAYKTINAMNTIIDKAPEASGSESKRKQIIAEAHIMRAYLHWLLVNIYARQYDATTAATDGGIAYVKSESVFADNPKLTVQEVYDNILADCSDDYIKALPERNDDVLRGDQAWGYAVRAKVLMQMKRYADALPYALKSIDLNGTIEDRSAIVDAGDWILDRQAPDNLVYIGGIVGPFLECLSKETADKFEAGDYVLYHAYMFGQKPGSGEDNGDEDGDDEEWDAKPRAAKSSDAAMGKKAFADDNFDASAMAWNSLNGEITTGVKGSLMYYAMSSWVNFYGITSDRMYYTAAECYIRTGEIQKTRMRQDRVTYEAGS